MRMTSWILVGCLACGAAAAEDWVEVIHSRSGTVWQVDRDSIQPAHPGVKAWFRFTGDRNLHPGGEDEFRSGRAERVFDCPGGRSADLAFDWYFEPRWAGAVGLMEHSDPSRPHWTKPRPGSIEDALMAYVCDYASRDPGGASPPAAR